MVGEEHVAELQGQLDVHEKLKIVDTEIGAEVFVENIHYDREEDCIVVEVSR